MHRIDTILSLLLLHGDASAVSHPNPYIPKEYFLQRQSIMGSRLSSVPPAVKVIVRWLRSYQSFTIHWSNQQQHCVLCTPYGFLNFPAAVFHSPHSPLKHFRHIWQTRKAQPSSSISPGIEHHSKVRYHTPLHTHTQLPTTGIDQPYARLPQ